MSNWPYRSVSGYMYIVHLITVGDSGDLHRQHSGKKSSAYGEPNPLGRGTPRKLATATQPQFPRTVTTLSWTHVTEWSSANWGNDNAVSSVSVAPFSNMCSTQADNSSRKLRLRCGCQFPWCALGLRVRIRFRLEVCISVQLPPPPTYSPEMNTWKKYSATGCWNKIFCSRLFCLFVLCV
jgi:hypothetical protein